jgi:CubicO group peptidase (beta-lactamase class C family)
MVPMQGSLWLGICAWAAAAPVLAQSFDAAVARGERMPRLHSVLVSRHGELILERYFHGTRAASYANVKSASKSVISALVGIAIERKLLPGIDAPIAPYFPELAAAGADARKRKITIEDLLTMRSGLTDTNQAYGAWVRSANWVHYLLAHALQYPPGAQMDYNTGNTHLLSAILTKATGSDTWSFAQKTLATPLGITVPKWPQDPQGIYFGGNDMLLTPRQMLKFGELYLHHGREAGRQIVPASWVEASFVPRTQSQRSGKLYGYGWWIAELAGQQTAYAWGFGGQYIFVVPSLDAVVVTTASEVPGDTRREFRLDLFDMIEEQVIGAMARSR